MRILTWNLERRKPATPYGKLAIRHLFSQNPDVMAISETRTDFSEQGGHTIWARHPKGHFAQDERKILIWSKHPWTEIDDFGSAALPAGRFISGVTKADIGEVRVVGVCIPYHMADVIHGTKNKTPWEQHKIFLEKFPEILAEYKRPVVIAGDFNQRIPRQKYGNREAALQMQETFEPYEILTKGIIQGMSAAGIDHIAIDKQLGPLDIWGWSNVVDGTRLSDHAGAGAEVKLA